jgi:hypothetical protein
MIQEKRDVLLETIIKTTNLEDQNMPKKIKNEGLEDGVADQGGKMNEKNPIVNVEGEDDDDNDDDGNSIDVLQLAMDEKMTAMMYRGKSDEYDKCHVLSSITTITTTTSMVPTGTDLVIIHTGCIPCRYF